MRRYPQHIRIAWTVLCGAFVLLTLLAWSRSYFREDNFTLKPKWGVVKIQSAHGVVWYDHWQPSRTSKMSITALEGYIREVHAHDSDEFHTAIPIAWPQTWFWLKNPRGWFPKFQREANGPNQFLLTVPYWLPLLVCSALGGIPWIRWSRRFSLRTLLVITTIAAIALTALVLSR